MFKEIKNIEKISWFPGHMKRGFDLIQQLLPKIDIFVEIRDAWCPISSFNSKIDTLI